MARYRSILSLILAFVTVFVVSCSSPTAFKPPTYTSAQLETIQGYANDLVAVRDRLPELATLIQNRKWSDVESFIHGPLGELRVQMSTVARDLLPNAQSTALETAKNVFGHLNKLDQAAKDTSYEQAIRQYAEALKDFDAFVQLLPQS
jgi:photosystem II protein PsbQ